MEGDLCSEAWVLNAHQSAEAGQKALPKLFIDQIWCLCIDLCGGRPKERQELIASSILEILLVASALVSGYSVVKGQYSVPIQRQCATLSPCSTQACVTFYLGCRQKALR